MPRLNTGGNSGSNDTMRSNYMMLLLITALFTIAGVNAANNVSEVVGPYKISFSLPDDVNVTVNATTENEESFFGDESTSYILDLRDSLNPANTAAVDITQYDAEEDLIYLGGSLFKNMKGLGYRDVTSTYREIDGLPGVLVVGSPTLELPEIHGVVYLFDNQTSVTLSSTLPWNNGTSRMLETFHIEKVE